MKNKWWLCVFIIGWFCFVCGHALPPKSIESLIKDELHFSADQFANYVYRRYYFINRLERTIQVFLHVDHDMHMQTKNKCNSDMFDFECANTITHSAVQHYMHLIKSNRSFKPLLMQWDDFIAYKSIQDQLLVEDFTKEIFIISRSIVQHIKGLSSNRAFKDQTDQQLLLPADQLLDIIDDQCRYIQEAQRLKGDDTSDACCTRVNDLKPFVHINNVMQRFYILKRVSKALWILSRLSSVYGDLPKKSPIRYRSFSHGRIQSVLTIIDRTGSIKPLVGLFDDVGLYKNIHDDEFVRQSLGVLLAQYHAVVTSESGVCKGTRSIEYVLQNLDSIPLEDLLSAVDIITEEMPSILEKYEFTSDMSWREWLSKYWWAPPCMVATICCRLLMHKPLQVTLFSLISAWASHHEVEGG